MRHTILIAMLLLTGCGISPAPRENLLAVSRTLDSMHAAYMAQSAAYQLDLDASNDAEAESLLRADILALAGKPTPEQVDRIISDDSRLREKQRAAIARIRSKQDQLTAHYLLGKRLLDGVQTVLIELERRKKAEDQLRANAMGAVEAGVAAAKGGVK